MYNIIENVLDKEIKYLNNHILLLVSVEYYNKIVTKSNESRLCRQIVAILLFNLDVKLKPEVLRSWSNVELHMSRT